jgi:hypothetical protein
MVAIASITNAAAPRLALRTVLALSPASPDGDKYGHYDESNHDWREDVHHHSFRHRVNHITAV